jgi:hypothetical protein
MIAFGERGSDVSGVDPNAAGVEASRRVKA